MIFRLPDIQPNWYSEASIQAPCKSFHIIGEGVESSSYRGARPAHFHTKPSTGFDDADYEREYLPVYNNMEVVTHEESVVEKAHSTVIVRCRTGMHRRLSRQTATHTSLAASRSLQTISSYYVSQAMKLNCKISNERMTRSDRVPTEHSKCSGGDCGLSRFACFPQCRLGPAVLAQIERER